MEIHGMAKMLERLEGEVNAASGELQQPTNTAWDWFLGSFFRRLHAESPLSRVRRSRSTIVPFSLGDKPDNAE
jgi:hypothetical protein